MIISSTSRTSVVPQVSHNRWKLLKLCPTRSSTELVQSSAPSVVMIRWPVDTLSSWLQVTASTGDGSTSIRRTIVDTSMHNLSDECNATSMDESVAGSRESAFLDRAYRPASQVGSAILAPTRSNTLTAPHHQIDLIFRGAHAWAGVEPQFSQPEKTLKSRFLAVMLDVHKVCT